MKKKTRKRVWRLGACFIPRGLLTMDRGSEVLEVMNEEA